MNHAQAKYYAISENPLEDDETHEPATIIRARRNYYLPSVKNLKRGKIEFHRASMLKATPDAIAIDDVLFSFNPFKFLIVDNNINLNFLHKPYLDAIVIGIITDSKGRIFVRTRNPNYFRLKEEALTVLALEKNDDSILDYFKWPTYEGQLESIGGKVEFGESPHTCIIRETMEEINATPIEANLCLVALVQDEYRQYLVHFFDLVMDESVDYNYEEKVHFDGVTVPKAIQPQFLYGTDILNGSRAITPSLAAYLLYFQSQVDLTVSNRMIIFKN